MDESEYQIDAGAATQHRDEIVRAVWQALLDAGAMTKTSGVIEGWTLAVSPQTIRFTKPGSGSLDPNGDGLIDASRERTRPEAADEHILALADQLNEMLNSEDPTSHGGVFPRQP